MFQHFILDRTSPFYSILDAQCVVKILALFPDLTLLCHQPNQQPKSDPIFIFQNLKTAKSLRSNISLGITLQHQEHCIMYLKYPMKGNWIYYLSRCLSPMVQYWLVRCMRPPIVSRKYSRYIWRHHCFPPGILTPALQFYFILDSHSLFCRILPGVIPFYKSGRPLSHVKKKCLNQSERFSVLRSIWHRGC